MEYPFFFFFRKVLIPLGIRLLLQCEINVIVLPEKVVRDYSLHIGRMFAGDDGGELYLGGRLHDTH